MIHPGQEIIIFDFYNDVRSATTHDKVFLAIFLGVPWRGLNDQALSAALDFELSFPTTA